MARWNKLVLLVILVVLPVAGAAAQTAAPHPAGQGVGGASSIAELRQGYLDAVEHKNSGQLERLFLWTGVPDDTRSMAMHHLFSDPQRPAIAAVEVKDVDAGTMADYTHFHAHFNAPVLKVLEVRFVRSKDGDGETKQQLFIGQSQGRFYFVTAVQEQGASGK